VEIITNILSEEQFRQELGDAMSSLAERGITDVTVSFEFTSVAPNLEDVGIGYPVPIADVPSFIADRERTKGFRFGLDDCWIEPLALDADFSSAMTGMSASPPTPSSCSIPSVPVGGQKDSMCIQMTSRKMPNRLLQQKELSCSAAN
jgi:hypothetical protein